jgi:hypothetical protein
MVHHCFSLLTILPNGISSLFQMALFDNFSSHKKMWKNADFLSFATCDQCYKTLRFFPSNVKGILIISTVMLFLLKILIFFAVCTVYEMTKNCVTSSILQTFFVHFAYILLVHTGGTVNLFPLFFGIYIYASSGSSVWQWVILMGTGIHMYYCETVGLTFNEVINSNRMS